MASRLPVIRLQPTRVLDWWPATGASAELLRQAYPRAQRVPVIPFGPDDPAPPAAVRPWWSPRRWAGLPGGGPEPVAASDLQPAAGELLWANMMLHWCDDPLAEMRRWHQALAVDGVLMFATFGPGTLATLREVYRARRWSSPHAPFVDMHDLGDMLVEAGFADPVMDQETLTLTWPDAAAMFAELRTLGANVDPARHAGLRTPRWRRQFADALTATGAAPAGRLALDFEIVYGHAFRPPPRPRVAAQTTVGLQDMRSILRHRPER